MHVLIRGDGAAARCCAHLLSREGVSCWAEPAVRPRLPAIMLGEQAQKLIADIFGFDRTFDHLPRIRKRIVSWGANDSTVAVEHSAVVISEEDLLDRLPPLPFAAGPGAYSWTVRASQPLSAETVEQRCGSRMASAVPVALKTDAEPEACWMESLPDGWLFLITSAPGKGWMLAVSGAAETLLAKSKTVAAQIAGHSDPVAQFPCSPRIVTPLAGKGWIACGSAAMAFDPICGDGVAHAVREAILASAVIKAALRCGDVGSLIRHYEDRLNAAFLRHLLHCVEYYSAPRGDWWREQTLAIREGIECVRARLGDPRFRYRLNGLDLEPVE